MRRRSFLLSAASAARVLGANEKIRLGLIGCGGRGRYVTGFMTGADGVELAGCADVDRDSAHKTAGQTAFATQDFRRLLERRDIDAVVIATPDHWHAGAAVLACEAGKHVYVEKPLSYSVLEGRAIVNAARRHKRIVLPGTQHRSAPHFAEIAELIRSGRIGDVRFVRVWNYSNMTPGGIGRQPDRDVPEGLDWDMYLGPAPLAPFNPNRFKRNFRWFRDYAGGTITDFGTHRFDTVHQVMGVSAPVTVSASGGRYTLDDGGEMPDVMQVTYEYPGFVMSYEACNLNAQGTGGRRPGMVYYGAKGAEDRPNGMAFYGTNATILADRIGYEIYPEGARAERKQANVRESTPAHARHFIDCLRGLSKPVADAETGQRSTTVGLLGNISLRCGAKLKWDAERESFKDAPEATKLLWREPRAKWKLFDRPRS